jgi:hypothetical protein
MNQKKNRFGLSSLFVFGRDIDAEAKKVIGLANQVLERASTTLDSSKGKAKASLEKLDEMRAILYRDSLTGFFDLYDKSLSGLKDEPPNTSQADRFDAASPSFTATAQLREPHSVWKKWLLTALLSGASAFIIFQILGIINHQQPIAVAIIVGGLLGLLIEMAFCYRRAHKNLSAAAHFHGQVTEYEDKAIRFSVQVEQLENDYPVAMATLEHHADGLNRQVESLNEIVRDSINAAQLLSKLIGMPLINGEGALLVDVMKRLEEDAVAAQEMQTLLCV